MLFLAISAYQWGESNESGQFEPQAFFFPQQEQDVAGGQGAHTHLPACVSRFFFYTTFLFIIFPFYGYIGAFSTNKTNTTHFLLRYLAVSAVYLRPHLEGKN